jgi:putative transposase
MTSSTKSLYTGHRFPPELISYTVWLYFRFPLSLRMVEEMLAYRGIEVSHETIRQWGHKFGQEFANIIRRRLRRPGDKWHLDEVVLKIAARSISSGGLWISTASCSMYWSRADATKKRPNACCGSC